MIAKKITELDPSVVALYDSVRTLSDRAIESIYRHLLAFSWEDLEFGADAKLRHQQNFQPLNLALHTKQLALGLEYHKVSFLPPN